MESNNIFIDIQKKNMETYSYDVDELEKNNISW